MGDNLNKNNEVSRIKQQFAVDELAAPLGMSGNLCRQFNGHNDK